MKPLTALVGVLLILTACTVGSWGAAQPSLAVLIVPDATDIKVVMRAWNTWQISYRAPGAPTTWSTDIAHQLEAEHWSSPDKVEYGSLNRSYSRAVSFGFGELWEWIYLTFDPLRPQDAQITVRRWIAIRWWQRLSLYAYI